MIRSPRDRAPHISPHNCRVPDIALCRNAHPAWFVRASVPTCVNAVQSTAWRLDAAGEDSVAKGIWAEGPRGFHNSLRSLLAAGFGPVTFATLVIQSPRDHG